jgi:hypothetical protein
MSYKPGAVGFRFGRGRNTMEAWYRIDDGPPRRWQDDYPTLIGSGVEVDGSNLSNPSDGVVWIPDADVEGAETVRIRVSSRGSGTVFGLTGLKESLDVADRFDCQFS